MTIDLAGQSVISIGDLSADDLVAILDLADVLKSMRVAGRPHRLLAGRSMAMLFQKPSTRTRVSFETGMTQLGGHAIYLGPNETGLGVRETAEDVALALSRYVDVIMARVYGHELVAELAEHATVPVINALSDAEHPCQALADVQTMREHLGELPGRRLVYVGDGNNVAHSLVHAAGLVGMDAVIVTPAGYEPDAGIIERAAADAADHGGSIEVSNDLGAVAGAEVLYTDVWASMGQEDEAAERRERFMPYQLNGALLDRAADGCLVMHCLPAHYGEEVTYEVTRRPESVVFDQAENRLHAQKALMVLVSGVDVGVIERVT